MGSAVFVKTTVVLMILTGLVAVAATYLVGLLDAHSHYAHYYYRFVQTVRQEY